jgi:outer membrane protein OmpA-like peptidoglycan-associated protein
MRTATTILVLLLAVSASAGDFQTFSIGGGVGLATFTGGSPPWFTVAPTFGARFEKYLTGKWRLEISLSRFKIYDDLTAHSEFQIGSDKGGRDRIWEGYDIGSLFRYRLFPYSNRFSIDGGFGGGLSVWKIVDAGADTTLKVAGEHGETKDLASTEIFLSACFGPEYRLSRYFKVGLDIQADYLTGAGLEFSESVEKERSRWHLKVGVFLSYCFQKKGWQSRWNETDRKFIHTPGPGEREKIPPDIERKSLDMIERADSDRDGIADIEDDCPGTTEKARGLVDIRGCPVDTDCDGIADYVDKCPHNPVGAVTDQYGCPLDSDGDGIYDGLDDCPDSEPDLTVDHTGCIDLSLLEKPMILNIKYYSGSFEIDRKTKKRLDELSRILLKAPGIRVEINGYTDNIGTADANRKLSEKRAKRVRDYLVRLGVDSGRLTPVGRGETNFVASNATREGRQKNRRVELLFFK